MRITLLHSPLSDRLDAAKISQEQWEWCCIICTHATYLCAGVERRVTEKLFRMAYVGIRPAMESALKCLWIMCKAEGKAPDSIKSLVSGVEKVYRNHGLFSRQMQKPDSLGHTAYRKVNGWAHADVTMWRLYKNGEEIDHVLKPMKNMVVVAQLALQRIDPTLVREHKYWSTKYE
jgi:hypothetical protein